MCLLKDSVPGRTFWMLFHCLPTPYKFLGFLLLPDFVTFEVMTTQKRKNLFICKYFITSTITMLNIYKSTKFTERRFPHTHANSINTSRNTLYWCKYQYSFISKLIILSNKDSTKPSPEKSSSCMGGIPIFFTL